MIETKKVYMIENEEYYASDLRAFGWEITENKIEYIGEMAAPYFVLTRDKEKENYEELRKKEIEYEKQRKELIHYDNINIEVAILLMILLIIPGVIYIIYKKSEEKKCIEHNWPYKKKMEEIVKEAKELNKK